MKITKEMKVRTLKPYYLKADIYSISDIERKAKGYFFSKDSMRFFRSRVLYEVFASVENVYFVTSEKYTSFSGPDGERLFTVRAFNIKSRSINTIGEFQAYETGARALSAALDCAYNEAVGV